MKLLLSSSSAIILLPITALTKSLPRHEGGCGFEITSSGSFACPAGQLPDGQIRLNGTENSATFYINTKGSITDSHGFGCIVTAPPTTQFQCDQGAAAASGFSIDSSNNILYHGSSSFYACPASDTEYNVYVRPEFGQTKCFPIALQASGCGSATSSCAAPSTVWQTQTVTEISTQILTLTTTAMRCSNLTSVASSAVPTVCHHCTETGLPSAI